VSLSAPDGKHVPRALGERLARLPSGARDFEQIAAVLVAAEAVAGPKPRECARLRSNLWVDGDSVFIVWPPRAAADKPADSPVPHWTSAFEHESFREVTRRLVSLVPSPLPGTACSKAEHDQAMAAVRGLLKKLETIEVWDEAEITRRLLGLAPLALHYLPEDMPDGHARLKRIENTRRAYDTELAKLYGKVQFIGMSVYKDEAEQDRRLPILVTLRRYADGIKENPDLSLLDYILKVTPDDLNLALADREFFEHYLYAGQAILLLDGVDELPGPEFKERVRSRVQALLARYPGNTVLVTSRIVGYEKEARYDALGFSHHCVAGLSLGEIETFVGDWYAARIENRKERERHASDLVRIVRDEDSRAIRELAENPLLLTIICLVHRIDAVLPDERVVLYEKCTETLLNTWHAWRFRPEEAKSRSKIERRNRARMEALAYWMHSVLADEKAGSRAVVPLAEIVAFLSEYIKTIERPRGETPRELAEEFLRFVKERAGLLIEAGSGLYSFVHLTFQEYLAATYLRKSGEKGGVGAVWEVVKDRCADARWHEVIRLLVGALERVDSQEYLLDRILDTPGGAESLGRAVLAGGCLLDSVEAAEGMREEIVARLLAGAASADSVAALVQPLRILRAWQERDPSHRALIADLVRQADRQATSAALRTGLALFLYCLGWEHAEVRRATCRLHEGGGSEARLAGALGLTELQGERSRFSSTEIQALDSATAVLSLASIPGNLLAAGLTALSCDGRSNTMRSLFLQLLTPLVWPSGPFLDRIRFLLLLAPRSNSAPLKLARDRARDRALDRAPDRALDRAPDRDRARGRNGDVAFWEGVLVEPELYSPLLHLVCDCLKLDPSALWWEALRLRVLPALPGRIALTDPEEWARVETVLGEGQGHTARPRARGLSPSIRHLDVDHRMLPRTGTKPVCTARRDHPPGSPA
jgi:hypothetical protein